MALLVRVALVVLELPTVSTELPRFMPLVVAVVAEQLAVLLVALVPALVAVTRLVLPLLLILVQAAVVE
jgi:hypothetical protein